ncbi:MAG: hypothetical protein AB7L36_03850 [Sphingomonadaceae bacterium]
MVLVALGLVQATTPAAAPPLQLAQVIIRERIIVRVPTRVIPERRATQWKEKSGQKCIPLPSIAGAALIDDSTVDFIVRGGPRLRAQLESSCPALDYYNGFYLRPGEDGMICADRDAIHARSGGECQIERFRRLVPKR